MSGLWGRVRGLDGEPVVGAGETPLREVLGRFDAGDGPASIADSLGLEAADLIAALGHGALGEEGSGGLPLTRSRASHPGRVASLGERAWAELLPGSSRPARLALAAGLFQIHDAWEASHEAAQQADDLGERAASAYWHAIAHRREPDAGNASYWFRRVGRHAILAPLAEAAAPLLEAQGDRALARRLTPGGVWDPFAFIEVCGDGRPAPGVEPLARRLQRLEMVLLLEATGRTLGLS